ncbi:thioredoxin family protein [Bacteroidota bacterium]
MKTTKIFTFVILILVFFKFAHSQEHKEITSGGMQFETGTWAEVLATAKEQSKPIIVDAFTDWCGPCKWMTANVFPTEEAGNFFNENFISYKLDMEKGEGVDFAKKYEVRSYPSYLFFNSEGELIHRSGGSKPIEAFIQDGKNALDPNKALYSLKAKYDSGNRDTELLYEYTFALNNANMKNTQEIAKEYLETQADEELLFEKNWGFINELVYDINSPAFKYLEANSKKFADKYGTYDVYKKIGLAKMNYYMANKDWDAYSKAAVEILDNNKIDDSGFLNQVAWTFYENVDDLTLLEKAANWAKMSIELEENYYNTDTYAALLYKLGKYNEALKAAEYAIEVAKKTDMDYGGTEQLIEMIKEKK